MSNVAELVGPSMKPVHSQKLLISAYVVINSRDKNVVIASFREKNEVFDFYDKMS